MSQVLQFVKNKKATRKRKRFFSALLFLFSCGFNCYAMATFEKKLVVIIPSFNNAKWYERNLSSIYSQKYNNYRVIYIDDCSTDNTYELVRDYIALNGQERRTKLIRNAKNRGALFNLYRAIHSCDDDAIILTVDGDDWLRGDQVFAIINRAYDDPNVWMTYGQFEDWPNKEKGFCNEIPKIIVEGHLLRSWEWLTSHLRTFYAWLFKKIKLRDLLYEHHFFIAGWDFALMFPMLEMAHGRWKFISEVLYIYNQATSLNDFKINSLNQVRGARVARSGKPYNRLPAHFTFKESAIIPAVDLIIFSEDKPAHLYVLLETVQQYMQGIGEITVLYKAGSDAHAHGYEKVKNSFSTVRFELLDYNEILSDKVNHALHAMPNEYCMFAHDGLVVKDEVDLHACITTLEQTHAYSFYLALGGNIEQHRSLTRLQQVPHFISFDNDIYAWQFSDGEYDWRNVSSFDLAVYRKGDVLMLLQSLIYNSCEELLQLWHDSHFDLDEMGLCFATSKAVIIESSKSSDMYLKMFKAGLKIDSYGFENEYNKTVKVMHEPGFVIR